MSRSPHCWLQGSLARAQQESAWSNRVPAHCWLPVLQWYAEPGLISQEACLISSLAAHSGCLYCRGTQPGLSRRCIALAPGFLPGQKAHVTLLSTLLVPQRLLQMRAWFSHSACMAKQCNSSLCPLPSGVVTVQLELVSCQLPTTSCLSAQTDCPCRVVDVQQAVGNTILVEQAVVHCPLTRGSRMAMQGGCCAGPGPSAGGSGCGHLPLQGC